MKTTGKELTVTEAVALLGGRISGQTIGNWIRVGYRGVRLQAARIGKRYFLRESDLLEFLAAMQPQQAELAAEETPK